ncbi:MAG: thiol-disulfide oxidoreductase DCC family protein [Ferruginibacter sp.]
MDQQPIILFDGICNFCNSAVNFVIKKNAKANILFAPMQSAGGQKLLKQYNLPAGDMQSFVFIENGIAYKRSTAALRVCRHLKGLWPLCYGLIIVPRFIRDAIYNWIAKNRYKWFGVRQECMIPTPEVKARFLN